MKANVVSISTLILLVTASLMLTACGTIQAGIETATPIADTESLVETQTPPSEEPTVVEVRREQIVAGWRGHVVSLPDGGQFDDAVILSPEGTGQFGITGADAGIEANIVELRDKEEPGKYAHFWGTLTCDVPDYNGCQLVVTRLRFGAIATDPEPVEGWEGKIISGTFNMGLGNVLVLAGRFPMWFSMDSNDETIKSQLDSLRDTEAIIRIWGELMTGIPDVNGSRIQVARIEILEEGSVVAPPPTEIVLDPTEGWETYINQDYGYQFRHPANATITEFGVVGFSSDELPEEMSAEEYIAQLQAEYGNSLCVHVEYALGYMYISAPPNEGFRYYPCGRTGVGLGEIENKTEVVTIGGHTYEANGIEVIGQNETLAEHNETFVFMLEDGTRIEYGARPVNDATYEDYLMKGKGMLLQILATYETTE